MCCHENALRNIIVAGALLIGSPCVVVAQVAAIGTLDHLVCYKIKDPLKLSTSVDMMAELQPDFARQGCKLTKPLEFCVPASKRNVAPPAANPQIFGQPLRDDYICYKAQCEAAAAPAERTVSDQFGAREIGRFRVQKVCVPARKEAIPCGLVGRRTCGGVCPLAQACRYDKAANACGCVPTACGGKVDEHGMCGGDCPTNQQCRATANKECACQPLNPPVCGQIAAGVSLCGGSCANPTDVCLPGPAGCVCQPTTPTCGLDETTGTCGGACLAPSEVCRSGPFGACSCQSLPTGPVSTYFGVASLSGMIMQPTAVENGIPVYELPTPSGFLLFAEFDIGASMAMIGEEGTAGQEVSGATVPNLQAWVGSALGVGAGLGSTQVCDDGIPTGEPIGGVPASTDYSNVAALQDFACRFDVRLNNDEACTIDQFGLSKFAANDTLKQFCAMMGTNLSVQSGDTQVFVRAADTNGVVGDERTLIIRVP